MKKSKQPKPEKPFDFYHDDNVPSRRDMAVEDHATREADRQCQALWNDLHRRRHTVEDVGAAIIEVNRQCSAIRAEVKDHCNAMKSMRQLQVR